MRAVCLFAILAMSTVLCAGRAFGQPTLPADQQVVYHIREVPSDPNSSVVFDVILSLSADAIDGNSVGWSVEQIEIHQMTGGGLNVWTQTAPTVSSADGRWWVTHANPAHPQLGEFTNPPQIEGTATAAQSGTANLAYNLTGVGHGQSYTPYAVTGKLSFALTLVGESQPLVAGTEEPVEVGDQPVKTPQ